MKHEVSCKHCGRFLFYSVGTTLIQGIICSNSKCKAKLNIKVVDDSSTHSQISFTFSEAEVPPKGKIPTSS